MMLCLLVGIFFVVKSFTSNRLVYLLLLIVLAVPHIAYKPSFIPIAQNDIVSFLIFSLMAYVYFYTIAANRLRVEFGRSSIALFLFIATMGLFHGLASGNAVSSSLYAFMPYALFGSYYLFYDMFSKVRLEDEHRNMLLLVGYFLFAAFMIYVIRDVTGDLATIRTGRLVSSYFNIFPLVLPLSGVLIFKGKNSILRLIGGCFFMMSAYIIILSQSRITWVVAAFQIILLIGCFLFVDNRDTRHFLKKLLVLSVFTVIAAVCVKVFILNNFSLMYRLKTLSPELILWDPSLRHRFVAVDAVIEKMNESIRYWFLGRGMGDGVTFSVFRQRHVDIRWVDNSFISLFWHTGLPGLLAYLMLLGHQLRNGIYLLKNSRVTWQKNAGLIILVYVTGFVFFGITSAIFAKYRFNLLWAGVWAYSDILVKRVKSEVPDG